MAEHDFIRLSGGMLDGCDFKVAHWPPPECLTVENFPIIDEGESYRRVKYSQLTDEQMETLGKHIARGALYELELAEEG